jgi:hypothetical protein
MNNFIFSPKNESIDSIKKEFFCLKNDSDFIDSDGNGRQNTENKKTLAKKIKKDNNNFYYIKSSISNKLFNPLSKLDRETSYSFLDNVVKPADKFLLVNQKVFFYYLKFLLDSNIAWFNMAERERL